MGKQTAQGTRWESRIVSSAIFHGRRAERLAKRGIKGEPDVRIGAPGLVDEWLPAVFWENWVKREHRRKAVRIVSLREEDFWKMVDNQADDRYGYLVQAKSTQTLSVRLVLERLVAAITEGGYE